MEFKFTPKYSIGEKVYMNVVEGEQHIIVDINFNVSSGLITYQIMDADGRSNWYTQVALTKEKIIV